MDKKNNDTDNDKKKDDKGDDTMVAISKPTNKMTIIRSDKSKEFIREFNRNVGSSDFIASCKKAGKLFNRGK